jgi:hypothetical protein
MEIPRNTIDKGKELISWQVPEYDKHKRPVLWYIGASVIASLFLLYAIKTENHMFAVIIIIGVILILIRNEQNPDKVKISITDKGIAIGKNEFYKFSEIKDFSFISNAKQLYFKSKSLIKPSFSVSLESIKPLEIQKIISIYLPENSSRKNEPFGDRFARWLKL